MRARIGPRRRRQLPVCTAREPHFLGQRQLLVCIPRRWGGVGGPWSLLETFEETARMHTTDAQVVRLRAELARGRTLEQAAMRAGMHRKTATKYASGPLPSERTTARTWRTREDPFEEDWPEMEAMLEKEPGLEAKALFEHLLALRPGRYQAGTYGPSSAG